MNKRLVDMDDAEVIRNLLWSHACFEQLKGLRSRLSDEYVRKERRVSDASKKRRTAGANELWAVKQALYLNEIGLTHWQRRYAVYSAEIVHRGVYTWASLNEMLETVSHEW